MTHTLDKIPLDEGSARRRDPYLTTHNTHDRQTSTGGIQTHNPNKQAAVDLRLKLRGFTLISQHKYYIQVFLKSSRTLWDTRERENEASNLTTLSILKVI